MSKTLPKAVQDRLGGAQSLRRGRGRLSETVRQQRFWDRVEKTPACWIWRGTLVGALGYGHTSLGNGDSGSGRAHRVSWEWTYGPIPKGAWVLHTCDIAACVRPDHLYLGDAFDNMRDAKARGRLAMGDRSGPRRFPESLARGEANHKAKLVTAQVVEIRALHADGASIRGLGRQFGVQGYTIRLIVQRKTWKHV